MKNSLVLITIIGALILAFMAGGEYGEKKNGNPSGKAEREILYYTDPMNPGFRSEEPGIAPCGMPLEPVYAETGDSDAATAQMAAGAVRVNANLQQMIGVVIEPVEKKPVSHALRMYGKITADETGIYRINASTDSWVREISDITTGSIVGRDQLLAEVLAPAFYNAQVTYLVAMDNLDRIQNQLGGDVRHQQTHLADNQIRVAVQALQNLGITDAQVEELANTRKARPYLQVRAPADGVVLNRNITLFQWFKAGEEFFEVADLSRVWVYADVYEDEARHLLPGMKVVVKHKQMGQTFAARISQVLPLFDPISKTLKVRIDIDNPQYELRPDMFVDVEIPITLPETLNIPADALIDTGITQVVYIDKGNRVFEPRTVETGWRLGRRIEITSGLMPGENVVISGNFLIDSESRMRTAGGSSAIAVDTRPLDPVCGMRVSPATAEEAGRVTNYLEEYFYFCADKCKALFDGNPKKYAKSGNTSDLQRDPVCGMRVDITEAEKAGRIATHGDRNLYFCSDNCKDAFHKEPSKFLADKADDSTKVMHAAMHQAGEEKPNSWYDILKPEKDSHLMMKEGNFPGQKMGRTIGTASSEVIDWDGPEKDNEKRDWSGWGKFPGSEYLGLENRYGKSADKKNNMAGMKNDPKQPENMGAHSMSQHPAGSQENPAIEHDMKSMPDHGKTSDH